jgi:phytol kinase
MQLSSLLSYSTPALAWIALYLILVILIAEILHKTEGKNSEIPRKVVHIGVGNVILIAWFFKIPFLTILQTSIASSLLCLFSYFIPIIYSLSGVGRKSLGSFFYSLSIGILSYIFWAEYPYYAVLGVLIMTWGDGLAAVIGKKFGRHDFEIFGMKKSLEGCLTMTLVSFVISFLIFLLVFGASWKICLIAFLVATLATLLELLSKLGIDNLTVPIGSAWLAYFLCIGLN